MHRLWEPLAAKQKPPNGYAAKFSTPYCSHRASCAAASGSTPSPTRPCAIPRVLAIAAKVRYRLDPDNPYPKNYTGHVRALLRDGDVVEERQPHMRGGAHEPLTRAGHRGEVRAQMRATAAGMHARTEARCSCAEGCLLVRLICLR